MASIVQKINTSRLKMHYVYRKGFRTHKRWRDAGLQAGTVAVRKVYFLHAVTIARHAPSATVPLADAHAPGTQATALAGRV